MRNLTNLFLVCLIDYARLLGAIVLNVIGHITSLFGVMLACMTLVFFVVWNLGGTALYGRLVLEALGGALVFFVVSILSEILRYKIDPRSINMALRPH